MMETVINKSALKSIFDDCRQCGTCCRTYRKIVLQPDEVELITRMGGHVGMEVTMAEIREKGFKAAVAEAAGKGKVYMVHPDDRGCIFLQHENDQYRCKIYHYRPKTCRGFRCNLADNSFFQLFGGQGAMCLLGRDGFGLPLKNENKENNSVG